MQTKRDISLPAIDLLPTPPAKQSVESLPANTRARMVVKTCMLCELAWDYTGTVLDIAAQMKLQPLKAASRLIKELRRNYERFLSPVLSSKDLAFARGLSELFEDVNNRTFSRLCNGLRTEMGRSLVIEKESEYMILAVQMVMTVIDAMKLYDRDCRAWMESYGVRDHTVIPSHMSQLAQLIPLYAGDLYDDKSEARRLTARILYNDVKSLEIYDEHGKVW